VARQKLGPVEAGVAKDLKALPADLRGSGLAASALALARELDTAENSATSKAMCARALAESLEKLRALAPPKQEADKLDELARRRARRRASKPARRAGS
jgi:hypothetical protein